MREFCIEGHDFGPMDATIGIDEGDVALGDGAVFITIVAYLVGCQGHASLTHLDIADGQHAAIFLVHRHRVRFEADVIFRSQRRYGAINGCQNNKTCDEQVAKKHGVLELNQPHRAILFFLPSPSPPLRQVLAYPSADCVLDSRGAVSVSVIRHLCCSEREVPPGDLL